MATPATLSSVPAQTPYIQYVATNGQTVFPYPFEITQDSDLIVVANGTTLGTDSGYTVSGVGASTGGNITFTSGRAANDIITLFRDIAISRVSQIAQNSGFSSTVFNAEYNNIYLLLQQLESSLGQCLQIPNTNNPAPTTTLAPAGYANKFLGFDGSGNPQPMLPPTLVVPAAGAVLVSQTPAEASISVTPTSTIFPVGNVLRYGADPTGAVDSTTAIKNAIASISATGGGVVYFPAGTYLFSSPLIVSSSGVVLQGAGYNSFHDGGSPVVYPVLLKYAGSGTAITFTSVNISTAPMIVGVGFQMIALDCQGNASTGLMVQSIRGGVFDHVFIKNTTTQAYLITALARTGATEATDTQDCLFTRCTWRNTDSAPVQSSHGMVLTSATPGSNGANVSFNTFEMCEGQCYNGIPWILADADNNHFHACRSVIAAGRNGSALEIRGADTNFFYGFSCANNNAVRIRGVASGYFANPVSNVFLNTDDSNGTPTPTVDANCRVQWHFAIGGWLKPWTSQAVFADNFTTAKSEQLLLTSETVRIRNGSQNHVVLSDGTNVWSVNIDASGNLRFIRNAGTGGVQFDGAYPWGINGVTPQPQVTGWGSPTGAALVANFPGSSATLAQCSSVLAQLVGDMKKFGFYGS